MPRKAVDYSKTVIYKIVSNDLNVKDIYVGSTSNFRNRKNCHKKTCNNEKAKGYNLKVYTAIRANGGWDNYSMIEIEKYPCKDKNEARGRERHWYEELEAKLNMRVPNRGQKEYNAEHREEQKNYQKNYRAEHREEQKEYKKKYNAEYEANHREKRNQQARERRAKKKAEQIKI